jgi:hypothetical protein
VKATDDIIWDAEAVNVGLIIFPGYVCPSCGERLPRNRDYFAPCYDRTRDGLRSSCRRCGRKQAKDSRRKIPGLS